MNTLDNTIKDRKHYMPTLIYIVQIYWIVLFSIVSLGKFEVIIDAL